MGPANAAIVTDASRPAGSELRSYAPGEFPYARAACLANTGSGGFDDTGYAVSEPQSGDLHLEVEAYLCAVRFPIVGTATMVSPLNRAEVAMLYSQLAEHNACLSESGEGGVTLGGRSEFERSWPAVGALPQSAPGVLSAILWQAIERTCPEPDPRR